MSTPNPVLIIGGANTVWADIEQAFAMHNFQTVIAINDIGAEFPHVDHWVSMHPEKMEMWLDRRSQNGFGDPRAFWTAEERRNKCPSIYFRGLKNTRGGSGLLAIYVARALGFNRIVLAGVPMDQQFDHYHTPGRWKECKLYRIVWEHDNSLHSDVRSLSGWTRERFGAPSPDWLGTHGG